MTAISAFHLFIRFIWGKSKPHPWRSLLVSSIVCRDSMVVCMCSCRHLDSCHQVIIVISLVFVLLIMMGRLQLEQWTMKFGYIQYCRVEFLRHIRQYYNTRENSFFLNSGMNAACCIRYKNSLHCYFSHSSVFMYNLIPPTPVLISFECCVAGKFISVTRKEWKKSFLSPDLYGGVALKMVGRKWESYTIRNTVYLICTFVGTIRQFDCRIPHECKNNGPNSCRNVRITMRTVKNSCWSV